ncbi:Lrp/AsnC family transcriptional regulator [Natrialbaceae archaeon A-chndr2]
MTDTSSEWRAGLEDVDAILLDEYQCGFPVRQAPYEALETVTGLEAAAVLQRVRAHHEAGIVRRLGPVLDPSVIGSSTLAALAVPEDEFAAAAEAVNGHPEVSHNYRRNHEWNMWFVLTAASRGRRDEILEEIATKTGLEPLVLPKRTEYRLDLQFPVVGDRIERGERNRRAELQLEPTSPVDEDDESPEMTARDATILEAIQDGVPLSLKPYTDLADELELEPSAVVSGIKDCLSKGFIKRFGLIIDHHTVGFRHNCMVVWAVPEDRIDAVGERAGRHPFVTKCYHRPRRPEQDWEYTLFTMIHARKAGLVDQTIEELSADIVPHPHQRLETVERLKQTGTRYERLLE